MYQLFRMFKRLSVLFLVSAIVALSSCDRNKVRQIPITDFFKNAEKSYIRISPDGKYISYLKSFHKHQNLFLQSIDDGKEIQATSFTDYSVRGDYTWTYDNLK